MICNQCGKDNTEDAVFCKYCGKRIDGMTVCPSCQKLIEDDSEFCIYCGHSLKNETLPNTEIAIKQVDKQKVVNYAVYAVTALLALLSIVFIFFIGIRQVHISSSGEVEYFDFDIFYYFKNAYKDYEQTLEFYNKWDNLSDVTAICKASLLLPTILGTVISVVALSGVCVFSLIAIVRTVKVAMGKEGKSGEYFALGSFLLYIFGIAGILSLTNFSENYRDFTNYVELSAATIAGIVLCTITAATWLGLKLYINRQNIFNQNNFKKLLLTFCGIIVAVVVVSVLTLPVINLEDKNETYNANCTFIFRRIGQICSNQEMLLKIDNAGAIFFLGLLSLVLLLSTIISSGIIIFKEIKNISSGEISKPQLKFYIINAVVALLTMIIIIVAAQQLCALMNELYNPSETSANITFTIVTPIIAFVFSLLSLAPAVAKKVLLSKSSATSVAGNTEE